MRIALHYGRAPARASAAGVSSGVAIRIAAHCQMAKFHEEVSPLMDHSPNPNSRQGPQSAHDPVAATIEQHLQRLEAKGWCELNVSDGADEVNVSFGSSSASAETYDIALIRLAGAIIDHGEFSAALMAALRQSLTKNGAKPN